MLSRVGFSPHEEQSRHSRAGGNPEPSQSTRLCAWMPACAGTTDQKTQAERSPRKSRTTRKTYLQKGGGSSEFSFILHGTPQSVGNHASA
ncbi:MAG: hypothetical protein EXR78_08995 [Deltaproteobacteria bacterium]|nr:hypothetical protein [Deltaproteobacteria bacterium]